MDIILRIGLGVVALVAFYYAITDIPPHPVLFFLGVYTGLASVWPWRDSPHGYTRAQWLAIVELLSEEGECDDDCRCDCNGCEGCEGCEG